MESLPTVDQAEVQLFTAAQTGEHGALRALWDRNRRYVAVVLLAHKPNESDVEDLLQEVAATMVTKIGTVRSADALLPWLRMVALNVARLAGRKLASRPSQSLDAMTGIGGELQATAVVGRSAGDPAETVRAGSDTDWILRLVSQLPDDYREPLMLRCLQDLSYRQIGEALGLPETTVETRIARGRRMFRELLNQAEKADKSRNARGSGGAAENGGSRI